MGKFKKGDVIRAKRDINGFFDKGAHYLIAEKIGQTFVLTDNDEPKIEHAKHHTDLSWLIENFELVTLKIEAGKFYKTRDGLKVGPMVQRDGYLYHEGWHYNASGECCYRGRSGDCVQEDREIIAEWIDEPVAKASNDNAQPKFKVGDRVKCLKSYPGQFTAGKEYVVSADHFGRKYESVKVKVDDAGSTENGWLPEFFELSKPTTTTIVALIENGQPKPSSTPHVHASTGAAEKEAKRLAAKYKGKQFGVFTLTTTHEEAAPVYDHKWQNMAALGLKIDAIKELRAVAGIPQGHAERIVGQFAA